MTTPSLEGLTVEILIKDPSYQDSIGTLFLLPAPAEWAELEIRPEGECEHETTGCVDCVKEWAEDYYVRLKLPNGAVYGLNDVPGYEGWEHNA